MVWEWICRYECVSMCLCVCVLCMSGCVCWITLVQGNKTLVIPKRLEDFSL